MFSKRIVAIALIFMGIIVPALAQSGPTVEIVLSQPMAQIGDTVTADVFVRGAVNMAGTDIGISVDPLCLSVLERQTGTFLPIESEQGGFSIFSELNEHDTRLAAALLQGGPIANGDGLFFRAVLKVTCETGIAPLTVTFAELTGIVDPSVEDNVYVTYRLDGGTVVAVNTQLVIGGQSAAAVTADAPDQSSATPSAVAPAETSAQVQTQPFAQIALAVLCVGIVLAGLFIVIVIVRRRRVDDQQ
ncbi:MAG: hypothetical protein KME04_08950 [Pleurocapsa minor GSE-CHR-MK-17-07R]|jgi:sensor c-di-GMP phosphodiesterase-like protein|nr:hypothetical protein [Pleurocapsa minor GSE-CHR-MK 17-07R]